MCTNTRRSARRTRLAVFSSGIRPRSSVIGVKENGIDRRLRDVEIVYEDDSVKHPEILKAVQSIGRPVSPSGKSEMGRLVYEYDSAGKRNPNPSIVWLNAGAPKFSNARLGHENTLAVVYEIWPGAKHSLPEWHLYDRQGRDWRDGLVTTKGSINAWQSHFDFDRWTWEVPGSDIVEPRSPGFFPIPEKIPSGTYDDVRHGLAKMVDAPDLSSDDVAMHSQRNVNGVKINEQLVYPDAPPRNELSVVREEPTARTGDPLSQSALSFYDALGRLKAQVQGFDPRNVVRRVTFYLSSDNKPYQPVDNNGRKNSWKSLPSAMSGSDFIACFVRGRNADNTGLDFGSIEMEVRNRVTGKIAQLKYDTKYPQGKGFWYPFFSTPQVQASEKSSRHRFINVQPSEGKSGPLYPAEGTNNARALVIPVEWLKDQNIGNVDQLDFRIVASNKPLEATAFERMQDPNGSSEWHFDASAQEHFFPAAEAAPHLRNERQEAIDKGNGIVVVVSGEYSQQKISVYEYGILKRVVLTARQLELDNSPQVRLNFMEALASHLRIGTTRESAFDPWLNAIIIVKQGKHGREEIFLPNANKPLMKRLLPDNSMDFNNALTVYPPLGKSANPQAHYLRI